MATMWISNTQGFNAIAKGGRHAEKTSSLWLLKSSSIRRLLFYSIVLSTCVWVWWLICQPRLGEVDTSGIYATSFLANTSNVRLRRKLNRTIAIFGSNQKVVTAYLEPIDPLWMDQVPLPRRRNASVLALNVLTFPQVRCFHNRIENFPIDEYPTEDPFLPWIHDYFPTLNASYIQFVAQNRRRCNSGRDHEATMKFWEPQVSLFQPVPVEIVEDMESYNSTGLPSQYPVSKRYRLGRSPDTATYPETRFICRFHNHLGQEATTFSEFNFNYEYITWRNFMETMMAKKGSDANNIWLSQLLFRCPVPNIFQKDLQLGRHIVPDGQSWRWNSQLWLDLVPIRTPARYGNFLFTNRHVGPNYLRNTRIFNSRKSWGANHVLPAIADSGRWANLPICQLPSALAVVKPSLPHHAFPKQPISFSTLPAKKSFHLIACTWTAASYTRRGDSVSVSDNAKRLREWIVFHLMVGFDHLYVYDNTQTKPSPLKSIVMEYKDRVTYHPWPCKICNNNRPNHPNAGERSSQYAAEASCRERYGPMTDWMAFMDTDEYLVPLTAGSNSTNSSIPTWHDLLHTMEVNQIHILKLRSSRAKPRHELMAAQADQSACRDPKRPHVTVDPCLEPRQNETLLRVYNCEFIKPPRPSRFDRAMKQIFRPHYVLSHFVHYSIVTADTAKYYADHAPNETYARDIHNIMNWISNAPEIFLDELTQGTLVHARSVLPHETMRRSNECFLNSKRNCILGYSCPDSVEFVDGLYQKNTFQDNAGNFCNCWVNERIETLFIPELEAALRQAPNG